MMKLTASLVAMLSLAALPAAAADRLTDRDVKSLVEKIDQDRDKFVDALDDNFKHTVIRNATGEVDVKRVLEDFEKSINQLKDRMKPEYSASTETAAMLRQATRIDTGLRAQQNLKGQSEWNHLAGDLKSLAAAYGADFPLAEGAPVRRIGDRELSTTIEKLGKTGEQVKKSLENDLKKDKSVDEASRKTLVDQADQWTKDVKALNDRVKDGEPSSAESDRVLQGATSLKTAIDGHTAPSAKSAWSAATPLLQTLAQAFGKTQ
jgi:hypothetical protein